VDTLRKQPGLVVTRFERSGGVYQIEGLRDPLAPDPAALLQQTGLDPAAAVISWRPFYALDDAILLRRAQALLAPPPGVAFTVKESVLSAAGEAEPAWIAQATQRATQITGIHRADFAGVADTHRAEFDRRAKAIEAAAFHFVQGKTDFAEDPEAVLAAVAQDIAVLLAKAQRLGLQVTFEVSGHTDATGTESSNLPLSRARARRVGQEVVRRGVRPGLLAYRGAGPAEPLRTEASDEDRRMNRRVSIRVLSASRQAGNR
jgi:OOP family OmpA-OmpF porin